MHIVHGVEQVLFLQAKLYKRKAKTMEQIIAELEAIKAELNLKIEYLIDIAKVDYINGIEETIDILDKHISELKK